MEQTAVEWLIDEHFGGIENCTPDFRNKIEQAKEMEKEQIIKAFYSHASAMSHDDLPAGESYYNKTFKQQEQ
jgi:hypothetical protein